jgi:hypothetical protein
MSSAPFFASAALAEYLAKESEVIASPAKRDEAIAFLDVRTPTEEIRPCGLAKISLGDCFVVPFERTNGTPRNDTQVPSLTIETWPLTTGHLQLTTAVQSPITIH